MKTTKLIVAIMMVTTCFLSMMTLAPVTSGLPPASGNWVISAAETVTGGSYNVTNGNLIIQKGGTLTLDGAQILINDTSGNGGTQYFVEVQNGGTLIMKNKALIRSSMNASNYYWFYIRQGANASITYSNISDVGNGNNWANSGVYINSNNVTIDHTNISRGYYGLIIDSVSPTISYNNIVNNDAYAIDINSASPNIHHNQIIGNGKGGPWWQSWNGINIMNSKVTLENNNIRSNGWKNNAWGWGVFAQVSNVSMRNNTIQANGAGGIYYRTHVTGIVADNTLTDNQDIGMLIESVSSPSIINNNVRAPNRHSLQVDGMSTPFIKGNYFNTSNDAGVHFDGPSNVTMIGNDLKVWTNGDGIYANDGAMANIINNTIYVENGDAVNYWNWAQGTVSGNTVWAGSGNGITISNWADVTVSSNKVNSSNEAFAVWDWGKAKAYNNDLVSRNNRGMVSGWWTELHSTGGTVKSFNEGVSIGPNTVATVDDTIVTSSNDNGVQIQGRSTLQMNDMTINSRNNEGLYVIDSVVDIVNSSITAGGADIRLGNSGQATPGLVRALNTTFNESDSAFDNDNGRLNVSWFAEKIWAEWQNSMRVPNAALLITNIHDAIVFNGTLNANGEIDWLPIQEYSQVRTSRDDYTRHNFTASKNNVTSYSGANVNKNVNIRIILQDLVNDPVLVISHPIDQGLYNTSLVQVNGTAQDPQSGIYQVTVIPQGRPQLIANGAEYWDKYVNLTDGQWTIQVNATNYAGVTTRDHVTITIDTVPPMLTTAYPHATELVNTTEVIFTGKTEIGANVTVNGLVATVDAQGNFSRNITLPEGVNTVVVASHDKALNFNFTTSIVTVDITPPPLAVFTPVDNLITPEGTLIATGSIQADATLSMNGASVVHISEPFTTVVVLKVGLNRLQFLAMDPAGNRNITVRNVIYDPTAPEVSVYNPSSTALTNITTMNITGMAKDLTLSRVTVNGVNVSLDNQGNYSRIVSLSEGLNEIEVTGYDMAGHITIVRRLVTLDTIAPPLQVFSPNDGLLTNLPTQHVKGSTEVGAKLTVDGVNATVSTDGSFDYTITLKEGVNHIQVLARDPAGNPTLITRTVNLDTQPPTLKVSSPKKGLSVNEVELSVKGTVSDNTAVAKLTVNGKEVPVTNGKFSTTLALKKGATKLVITATDTAGNVATQEVKVSRGGLTMSETGLLILAILLMVIGLIIGIMLAKRKMKGTAVKASEDEGVSRFDDKADAMKDVDDDELKSEPDPKRQAPALVKKVKPEGSGGEAQPKVDDKVSPGPPKDALKVQPTEPAMPKKPEGQEAEGEMHAHDHETPKPTEKTDMDSILSKLKE